MDVTPEVVRELLHYNPETGVFTWRERDRKWFKTDRSCLLWNARDVGTRAGCVWASPKTGYQCRYVNMLGKSRKEHRLAWMWMTDEPLPPQIDHENRDATDNRWTNLRASSYAGNSFNRSMKCNNTSGITGVYWNKRHGKWLAQCGSGGSRHHLGYFDHIDEAAMEVMEFRAEHGFSPAHGLSKARYVTGIDS